MPYGGVYRRDPWTTWSTPVVAISSIGTLSIPTAAYDLAARFRNQPRNRVFTLARRGKFFFAPFTALSLEQAVVPEINTRPANRSPLPTRRGIFFRAILPVTQQAPAPAFKGRPSNRSPLPTRRGKFFFAPFNALSLEQAVVPDFNGRPANRSPLPFRRGRFSNPPWVGLAPGQYVTPDSIHGYRNRLTNIKLRRGAYFTPPFIALAPGQFVTPIFAATRRLTGARFVRRGQFFQPVPASVVVAAPAVPPTFRVSRRLISLTTRRGAFVFRGHAAPAAGAHPFRAPRRLISFRTRHGIFFSAVLPVTQQAIPNKFSNQWRNRLQPFRRGQFFGVPPVGRAPGQIDAPDRIRSQHPRVPPLARRGLFRQLPFPVVIPPGTQAKPPSWIIPALRNRVFTLARRGHVVYVPLVGLSPVVTTTVPDRFGRSRNRWLPPARRGAFKEHQRGAPNPGSHVVRVSRRFGPLTLRRGAGWKLVLPQQAPPPTFTTTRRISGLRLRSFHGTFQPVPLVSPDVVTFRTRRRAFGPRVLQRRAFQPVPLPLAASSVVPQLRSTKRRTTRGVTSRRGQFQRIPIAAPSTNGGFFDFFG